MVYVFRNQERDEHVPIEESCHSSSSNERMSSLVTSLGK